MGIGKNKIFYSSVRKELSLFCNTSKMNMNEIEQFNNTILEYCINHIDHIDQNRSTIERHILSVINSISTRDLIQLVYFIDGPPTTNEPYLGTTVYQRIILRHYMYYWEQLPIGRRNYSPSRRPNIQIYNDENLVLEDKECPICLEKKCNAQLKCLHIYCKQCIIQHSTISTTGCPECRTCITEILLGKEE